MVVLSKSALAPIPSAVTVGRIPRADMESAVAEAMADPDPANLFMRLFYLFQSIGLYEMATDMHAKALERRRVFKIEGPTYPRIRLLALMGPDPERDNSPIEYVVDGSGIELTLYYYDADNTNAVPPDHDLALVAIGESERGTAYLRRWEEPLRHWLRPVLNRPERIPWCARDRLAELLADVPGLVVPLNRRLQRDEKAALNFPCVIRPLDTHGGQGFAKIDDDADRQAYFATHHQTEFYSADYYDYRSSDGQFRKYRIALIDHEPHLCHLAIADEWMVHYLTAGMDVSEAKRAEEAHAFSHFHTDFGLRHREALSLIAQKLDLDFVVLDCAELPDGRLLLFEADNRGWIHAVDAVDLFGYKAPQMKRVFEAFEAMLDKRLNASRGK